MESPSGGRVICFLRFNGSRWGRATATGSSFSFILGHVLIEIVEPVKRRLDESLYQ